MVFLCAEPHFALYASCQPFFALSTLIRRRRNTDIFPGVSNWIEGKRLPGHGNATDHIPELVLNGFRTPLGLLVAHLFRTLFPAVPQLQGRQVVTARTFPSSSARLCMCLTTCTALFDHFMLNMSHHRNLVLKGDADKDMLIR